MTFVVIGTLAVDFALWCAGGDGWTISAVVQAYMGGSAESARSAMFGFILGVLLVHFTRWGGGTNAIQ